MLWGLALAGEGSCITEAGVLQLLGVSQDLLEMPLLEMDPSLCINFESSACLGEPLILSPGSSCASSLAEHVLGPEVPS